MTRDERAASVPINYTLSIVVVTVLMAGLMMATSGQLRAQQERTVGSEFSVLGNRMAADINAADRLAQTMEDRPGEVVEVRTQIPEQVAGMTYHVEVNSTVLVPGEAHQIDIRFVAGQLPVTEEVRLKTATPVQNATLTGGEYVIEYVDGDGDGDRELVISNV